MHLTHFSAKQFAEYISTTASFITYFKTPAGVLRLWQTELGVYRAEFVCDEGETAPYVQQVVGLILVGTDFQQRVWQTLLAQEDNTITYQKLAADIGDPRVHRAVANALAANKIAYFIPCHRVIRSDGSLGGYAWGIERKKQLLKNLIPAP